MGTIMLSVLAGHWRYPHNNAIRGDGINPGLLGMRSVCSEDAIRLATGRIHETAGLDWLSTQILASISPALGLPWILDIEVAVKPLYDAPNNRWLEEQGVPDINAVAAIAALKNPRSLTAWTEARSQSHLENSPLRAKGPSLIETALYNAMAAIAARKTCEVPPHGRKHGVKAVRRVVWDPGANYSRGPASA